MKHLITRTFFDTWKSMLDVDIEKQFNVLIQKELEPHSSTFYTSVSVMSSSRIEGEQMEVDSYVKHKMLNIEYLPELTEKPNDLYNAYLFAKDHPLTKENFTHAHELISAHLLHDSQRGKLRTTEMLVMEHKTGRIQYEAAPLSILEQEYEALWNDIKQMLGEELSPEEIFYVASFIHLAFVCIHPFGDGNGRIGRLLEKWFLAEKLGERAWYIQSEKFYYRKVNSYYHHLSTLGMFYEKLDYTKSIPFLLMLPQALRDEGE